MAGYHAPMAGIGKSFVSLGTLAMSLLGGCARSSTPSEFLALGDSYTIGQSVDADARWPVQLAAMLKRDGNDLGPPTIIAGTGWTTSDLSTAMDQANPKGPFDLVTLMIGVNNQFRSRDPEEYRQQFSALLKRSIALAGHRSTHVLVISIPDWGVTPYASGQDRAAVARSIDAFNAIAQDVASSLAVKMIDVTSESRAAATQPALIATDGLHPSADMYRQWASTILPLAEVALQTP